MTFEKSTLPSDVDIYQNLSTYFFPLLSLFIYCPYFYKFPLFYIYLFVSYFCANYFPITTEMEPCSPGSWLLLESFAKLIKMQIPVLAAGPMKQTFCGESSIYILNKPIADSYHQFSMENRYTSKLVSCNYWLNICRTSFTFLSHHQDWHVDLGSMVWFHYNHLFTYTQSIIYQIWVWNML